VTHLKNLNSSYRPVADYKNPGLARQLLDKINSYTGSASIMEVCGTHTVALFKSGIRDGLNARINLVSGPGCPVCVTGADAVEKAIGLACRKNTVLFCFGDMVKVPGARVSLDSVKAERDANVKIMYSPLEALEYAKNNPLKDIVLFGVGFETTVGLFASTLIRAKNDGVKNLHLLCAFKLVPPALRALLSSADVKVDGLLLPGHVSAILGAEAYRFMADEYHVPGVIAGFEPVDMLEGILMLTRMIGNKQARIVNEYSRIVTREGNLKAKEAIASVFTECDARWRGLGEIPGSGLKLNRAFSAFDAEKFVDFPVPHVEEPRGCKCPEVIKGKAQPTQCPLFRRVCTPSDPVGPCMVSSEGTCAAYYKYGGKKL